MTEPLSREERAEFNAINRQYATPIVQLTQDEYQALRSELLLLTARAVRAEADAKRLDALEAWIKGDQMLCPPGNHGGSEDHWLLSREDELRGTRHGQWCDEYEGATLREAIDAASAPRPATP